MAKITFKIWILIFLLIAATFAINPTGYFKQGVIVKDIDQNSSAALAGIAKGDIITEINNEKIKNLDDYNSIAGKIEPNTKVTIKTGENSLFYIKEKGEYPFIVNNTDLGIVVSAIPKTNVKMGLEMQGGSRALVKPEIPLTAKEMDELVSVISNRLNVYGITDLKIRSVSDLSKNNYILVELAGATPSELRDLVSKQGKFEAKIGNETVFVGGKNDITFVCRSDASCAGIRECDPTNDGYYCKFMFSITLSEDAAKKSAAATANLTENISASGESYLSQPLDLYLDDKQYDSLQISSDLKGQIATQISISGPGTGATQKEAFDSATLNMKKLQTVLITGSLPYKLEIVKLDSISPSLGKEFVKNLVIVIIATWLGVFAVLFIRYRKILPVLLVMFTLTCEIYLVIGAAALINWNLDLASIAGIIAAIGTGVDDQVVIIDESKIHNTYSWKERAKRAFGIILGSFATVFVAMLPLGWAGAGLFKGFALTTLIGITLGVTITRPAFSDMLRMITKD